MTTWMLICVALISLAYYWVCRRANLARPHYEKWANKFYDSSRPLIQDDDTPVEILKILRFLNFEISNTGAAREAFWAISGSDKKVSSGNREQLIDVIENFSKLRPELGQKMHEAFASALLAVSYNSLFFGFIFRRMILFDLKDKDSTQIQIVTKRLIDNRFLNLESSRCLSPA